MSLALVKYVLKAAMRDRLFVTILVAMIISVSLSVFMASSAVSEKDIFVIVFAAGSLRMVGVAGLVLFVVFFMRRSFDARDIEFLLARPVGRMQLIASFAGGFALLAFLLTAVQGGCLYILSPHMYGPGSMLWMASMLAENIIMVTVALFFSMILTSAAMATMACFGLYVLGRMIGQILGIIDADPLMFGTEALSRVMQYISVITPRFDLMGQSGWIIYGPDAQVGYAFLAAQCIVFSLLILLAALIDLIRRQF